MYFVYIAASLQRVLYIGITSNLPQRMWEHKTKKYPRSFTALYNCTKLVYAEMFDRVVDALAREKQLKGWRRGKKIRLIEKGNPHWLDLTEPPLHPGPSLRSG